MTATYAQQKQLSIHSVLFATEIYSILGQYAANIAHDIALIHIQHETQVLPQDCLAFLPRDLLGAGEKHKKKGLVGGFGVGRKPIGERFLQRPGWESAMKGENGVKR